MRGSKFGWSLPPGCGALPGEEEDGRCEVCRLDAGDCICPACTYCNEVGRLACYEAGHELPYIEDGVGKTIAVKMELNRHQQITRSKARIGDLVQQLDDERMALEYLERKT